MNKLKFIISLNSQTMTTLFEKFLKEKGYEVIIAESGTDLLKKMVINRPDFIMTAINLSDINGYNICRIIKNSNEFSNTKVILCSIDNGTARQYWAEISKCDAFYFIDQADISSLGDLIVSLSKQTQKKAEQKDEKNEVSEEDLVKLVVNSYDKEFFDLNIIKNAFNTISNFDYETLLGEISKTVKNVFNYDALGLIVNANPFVEFYSFNPNLDNSEKEDFIKVCRSDFEAKALGVNRFDWKKSKQIFNVNSLSTEGSTIKSSENYPHEGKQNLALSMTVGCNRANAFFDRTTKRLAFISEVYENVMQSTIAYNKLATAEDNIAKAFGHFVPQGVINDIVSGSSNNASNTGEKRNVAIMFSDIRSFTSISEINEPEKVVDFLNQFFTIMGRIIKKHGGIIDKFMGDAIMALFGAPESFEDNAARASRAAIEMHQALKDINIDLKLPPGYQFAFGTGIHYGPVIVGSLGSEEKKEYTVIGDNVNLASRIEGLTKLYGSSIIVSGSVKNDLNNEIPMRHLDNVKVKGKSIAIPIYEISPDGFNQPDAFYEFYNKALNQYTLGNFIMAIEYLEKAYEINPCDKATQVLMERCREYKENPPENWDGAEILRTK